MAEWKETFHEGDGAIIEKKKKKLVSLAMEVLTIQEMTIKTTRFLISKNFQIGLCIAISALIGHVEKKFD